MVRTVSEKDVEHIFGWFCGEDLKAVNYIVSMLPDNAELLEVGSCYGKSTVVWAKTFIAHNKNYHIHCIDGFTGVPCLDPRIVDELAKEYNVTQEVVENYSINLLVSQGKIDEAITSTSSEQLEQFINNTKEYNVTWEKIYITPDLDWQGPLYDCVFYDGDHTFEGTKFNLEFWKNHVKPGGILCIHDYSDEFRDTTVAAVECVFPDHSVKQFGTVAILRMAE